MLRTILLGISLPALSLPAMAQDLPQASDTWFAAGQKAIAARMDQQPITTPAKNVILFTADGNGVGTNYAIRLFEGQKAGGLGDDHVQPHETFPYAALIKTYSANGQTPDSAPTASAMNTGIKTKNDLINVPDSFAVSDCVAGRQENLRLLSEIASETGKSVGVISTARITHATPAAVYARSANRDWEDNSLIPEDCDQKDIAEQLIDQMKAGVIDLALGGGRTHFLPADVTDSEGKRGARTDGRNLMDEAREFGATVVENDTDFAALSTTGNNAPVLGLFEASHMKYEHDRTGEPSLAEMTEAAIKSLSSNDQGFYISIEAGRVDHANHAGNLYRTLTDGVAFNDAIRKAVELTNPEETLIVVTADHEHALTFNGYCGRGSSIVGLCMEVNEAGIEALDSPNLGDDGKPYTVAGFLNGAGSVLVEQAAPVAETATAPAETADAIVTPAEATPDAADAAEEAGDPDAILAETSVSAAETATDASAPEAGTTAETTADATASAAKTIAAVATDNAASPEVRPGAAAEDQAEATVLYAAPEGRPDVTEEEATDPDYLQQALVPLSSETHSGEDVMAFAQGPWAHLFSGTMEQNAIFHVMHHAITTE